jgi:hypothetical protein
MKNLLVRCSELKNLMTKSRSKKEALSETTKSWIKEKVKEEFYGYRKKLDGDPINKGIDMEDLAIEMLNEITFNSYKKNQERKTNSWLTGEADIVSKDTIEDIKCSFTLETFPAFAEDAYAAIKKAGYDWQLRGYMLLWNKPKAKVQYCMVSTPDYIMKDWYNKDIHKVDKHEPTTRLTTVGIHRDEKLEDEMLEQYALANEYYKERWEEINNK